MAIKNLSVFCQIFRADSHTLGFQSSTGPEEGLVDGGFGIA